MLTACYDLKCSPPTYDIVAFLLQAEVERVKRGEQQIFVKFMPGPVDGFRGDALWPPADQRKKMLENVAVPMCWIHPRVVGVEILKHRNVECDIGKDYPLHGFKKYVEAISSRCLRPTFERLKNKKLVTITLRESDHWPERNSNKSEWIKAANNISAMGYEVVFVRDTNSASEGMECFPINVEASLNLEKRAALYWEAYCNLFVSNGPAWVSMAMDAPTIILKPTVDSLSGCYTRGFMAQCGLPPDSQLPDCPKHQRIVWKDDTCENITTAFYEFSGKHN